MPINMGGLASGLDVESIISSLASVEQVPISQLNNSKALVDQASSTLGVFSSKLSTLRATAQALKDPNQFASFTASSSDTGAVTASIFGSAAAGSYDVKVLALAKEQKTFSDTFGSSTNGLGLAGTLDLTINGVTKSVTVGAGDSLATIAANINGSGARATAAVIFDGTNYQLQVRGLDTGLQNAVTFGENGFTLGLNKLANQYQNAQDASVKVDGVTVTRPSNQVVGVIPGVTLALSKVSVSDAIVTVAGDPTALQNKVQAFVTAYNDIVKAGQQAAGYGSTKATNSELAGDSSIRSVLSRLSALFSQPITGTSGVYASLGSVGIGTTKDGTLQFDKTKLSGALSKDPTAVARIFTTDPTQQATGVMSTFATLINTMIDAPDSVIGARVAGLQKKSRDIATKASDMQARVDTYTTRLRAQFTAMDQAVAAYKSSGTALTNWLNSNNSSSK